MTELYSNLDTTMQVFWGIAILSTIIFALQTVMTIIGIDSADGMDADIDISDGDTMDTGGAMSLFSIRSMVNFLVGFGWTGVCLRSVIENTTLLYVVAIAVGLALGYIYIIMWRNLRKLETSGNIDINNCVGKEASVYLRIPGNESGKGKIHVSINGSIREFDAMTTEDEIPTGCNVHVERIEGTVLYVRK